MNSPDSPAAPAPGLVCLAVALGARPHPPLVELLRELGHQVTTAASPQAAQAMLQSEPVDVVFLEADLGRPEAQALLQTWQGSERLRAVTLVLVAHPEDLSAPVSIITAVAQKPPRAAGVKVTDEGDGGTRIAEFLIENRLV